MLFFFSSRRRHTRWPRDWSSDVCSSDLRSKLIAECSAGVPPAVGRASSHAQQLNRSCSLRRRLLFQGCSRGSGELVLVNWNILLRLFDADRESPARTAIVHWNGVFTPSTSR